MTPLPPPLNPPPTLSRECNTCLTDQPLVHTTIFLICFLLFLSLLLLFFLFQYKPSCCRWPMAWPMADGRWPVHSPYILPPSLLSPPPSTDHLIFLWEPSFCGSPLFMGALFLWEPSFCGSPLFMGALFLWEPSFCGSPLFVEALLLWEPSFCGSPHVYTV